MIKLTVLLGQRNNNRLLASSPASANQTASLLLLPLQQDPAPASQNSTLGELFNFKLAPSFSCKVAARPDDSNIE